MQYQHFQFQKVKKKTCYICITNVNTITTVLVNSGLSLGTITFNLKVFLFSYTYSYIFFVKSNEITTRENKMRRTYFSKLSMVLAPALGFIIAGISMFFTMYWILLQLPSEDQRIVFIASYILWSFGSILIVIGFLVAYEKFALQQNTDNFQCDV